MCGVYKPTNVISLSYGGQEADIPVSYQKRQCLEYMKLGLQGVSFLYASGDSGVSSMNTFSPLKSNTLTKNLDYPTEYGGTNGPTGCLGPSGNIFNPTWPGTCPFVTSVGATKVYPGSKVTDAQPESAVLDPILLHILLVAVSATSTLSLITSPRLSLRISKTTIHRIHTIVRCLQIRLRRQTLPQLLGVVTEYTIGLEEVSQTCLQMETMML